MRSPAQSGGYMQCIARGLTAGFTRGVTRGVAHWFISLSFNCILLSHAASKIQAWILSHPSHSMFP